jgi:uncharacterized membrane protein YgdD (TMEM256/DUF423 family)
MHKNYLAIAAFFGGLAVALGAFGAHGLEQVSSDEKVLQGYRTGVQYQMYHAIALLFLALAFDKLPVNIVRWAANCFITGIILFSGSLYLITFLKIQESEAVRFAGPVTPVGGLFFIVGWLFLLIAAIKRK